MEDNVRGERKDIATVTVQKGKDYRLSNKSASVAIIDR
jgi:hypothetical protein